MNHLLSVSGNPSGSFFVFRHPHMQASSSVVHIALLLICAALLGPNLVVDAKACGRLGESCPSYYACSFDTYCEPSVNKCLARKPPGSSCSIWIVLKCESRRTTSIWIAPPLSDKVIGSQLWQALRERICRIVSLRLLITCWQLTVFQILHTK